MFYARILGCLSISKALKSEALLRKRSESEPILAVAQRSNHPNAQASDSNRVLAPVSDLVR